LAEVLAIKGRQIFADKSRLELEEVLETETDYKGLYGRAVVDVHFRGERRDA
jgi:hypothetical protein